MKEADAIEQQPSSIGALRAAAPTWLFD